MAHKSIKRNCSRLFATALLLIVLAVGGVCGTLAFLIDTTDSVVNTFLPAEVDGDIIEEFDGEKKSDITVKNTGTVPAYVRVRLLSYWYDATNDQIIAQNSWFSDKNLDLGEGWFKAGEYYYYSLPIDTDALTNELFTEAIILDVDSNGNRQVLEVLAEAIQSKPADAVEEAWNVEVGDDDKIAIGGDRE